MTASKLLIDIEPSGIATLTINRAEQHNTFDDALVIELTSVLRELDCDAKVRVLLLASAGRSFSAGADLNWMRRTADYSHAENLADSVQLAEMLRTLNELAKPTIALVQGPAYGGGVGLISCCDIALATERAAFCLSEVKLGLIPAVISPYVIQAIGSRAARRYMLTAERFDALEALRLGLIHELVAADRLVLRAHELAGILLNNGPRALSAAKALIAGIGGRPIDAALIADTANRIADIRAGAEGKEGVGAFLDKRQPSWVKGS